MTDPAQVTEPVSWWQGALGGGGLATVILAAIGWLTKRTEATAQVEVAQVEARVESEREDTAQHRIEADADRGAFERAFDAKAVEHRECIDEVRQLRAESAKAAAENATQIANLRVELAECRKDHEHRDEIDKWMRENVVTRPGAPQPPPPRVRPHTPPNGTDVVTLAPVPVARKDPRREP